MAAQTVDLQTVQWVVGLAAGAISGGVTSLLAFAVSLAVLRYKSANHESRLGAIETDLKKQSLDFASIQARFDALEKSAIRIESKLDELRTDLHGVEMRTGPWHTVGSPK